MEVGDDRQLKGIIEAFGEKEDFDRFDRVGFGIAADEDVTVEVVGFLFGVGGTFVDEEDVTVAIVGDG